MSIKNSKEVKKTNCMERVINLLTLPEEGQYHKERLERIREAKVAI